MIVYVGVILIVTVLIVQAVLENRRTRRKQLAELEQAIEGFIKALKETADMIAAVMIPVMTDFVNVMHEVAVATSGIVDEWIEETPSEEKEE